MYYLVGLGNPGDEHKKNRHNVGFLALDFIVDSLQFPTPTKAGHLEGKYSTGKIHAEEVGLLYPETFMNNSGIAVKKLVPKGELPQLVVLYDDVALPLGSVKVSFDRGDGGHNGLKSIIGVMNSKQFIRVRIGVGETSFWTRKIKPLSGEALPRFVLGNFSSREMAILTKEVFPKIREIVSLIVEQGYVKAMNVHNS